MPPTHETKFEAKLLIPIISLILSILAILTSIAGWIVVHKLVIRREKRTRKQAFLAFMARLREEITKVWVAETFGRSYYDRIPTIKENATLIYGDIGSKNCAQLEGLVNVLCGYTKQEAAIPNTGKQRILDALDAITNFLHT